MVTVLHIIIAINILKGGKVLDKPHLAGDRAERGKAGAYKASIK